MPALSCRFYKKKFPDKDEVVMVNVRSIAEMGAYVDLSEYNNIEGMILLSELSRRRIRSINKLIRIGKSECVVVIRVDKEKGYIDLSKRRVLPEDILRCEDRYAKAKAVNSILRHVAEILEFQTDEQLEELYDKTAWHFDEKMKRPGAAFEAFKAAVNNPAILDECGLDAQTKETLLSHIRKRLMPQAVKARADIEVNCYGYDGIDAVKRALKVGMEMKNGDSHVKINLITPPQYVLTTQSLDKESGLKLLQAAIEEIEKSIKEQGGGFSIIQAPKLVTEVDEAELAKRLDKLREENEEVPGDDDDEDGEVGSDEGEMGVEV